MHVSHVFVTYRLVGGLFWEICMGYAHHSCAVVYLGTVQLWYLSRAVYWLSFLQKDHFHSNPLALDGWDVWCCMFILLWDKYVIWRITACTGNVWENSTGQCMAKIGENFPNVPRRRRAPRSKGLDACFNARTSVVPECAHNSSTACPKYWFFTELIRHMT